MKEFTIYTLETAPDEAKAVLQMAKNTFGFIPNLLGIMSNSPALAEAYLSISGIFDKSGLTPTERQVVLLTASHYHECHYCVAAHSAISAMQNVPVDVVDAIRINQPIADKKLQALRVFVFQILEKRAMVTKNEVHNFLSAGYETSHVMDVLVGVAQKTMSNYTNHIAETPLDDAFSEYTWNPDVKEKVVNS